MELKCPLTLDEQLDRLSSHGIKIGKEKEAKEFLQRVSYYRLTGYTLRFRKNPSSSDLASEHEISEINCRLVSYRLSIELQKYLIKLSGGW